ncbi:MAG: hypothetical protein FJ382_14690 [Verrucomicrobia bacterium]|nr:hypothetical protein [Verrucomicrobiota bacterium]
MKKPVRITISPSGYKDDVTSKWVSRFRIVRIDNAITVKPYAREIKVGDTVDDRELEVIQNSSAFEVSCLENLAENRSSAAEVFSHQIALLRKELEEGLARNSAAIVKRLSTLEYLGFFGVLLLLFLLMRK